MERKMSEPSETDRKAMGEVAKQSAKVILDLRMGEALRQIFSPDQLSRIDGYCKKHGVDRRAVISDIVEAGMEAKGILPKRKGGPKPAL
jgi:hypothetical protein